MQAEHNLEEHAQWKQIQENTFTRWANEHLKTVDSSLENLETDLSDGLRLIALIEVLSQKQLPSHNKRPTFISQKLENVSIALSFLEEEGIKIVNIDSSDIVEGKLKLILGLIWTLILHYSISMPVWEGEEEHPPVEVVQTPKQRLLYWIQSKIPDMSISNFTKDWTTGKPMGALVDACAPGLCPDWELWYPENNVQNAEEAMQLADDWLDVRQLIRPEELVDPNVDEQSVMTYLAQFPNCKLKDGAPLRPKTDPNSLIPVTPVVDPVIELAPPVVECPAVESVPSEPEVYPAEVYPGIESSPAEVYPGDVCVPAEVGPGPRPAGPYIGESAIIVIDSIPTFDDNHSTEIGRPYEGISYLFTGRILPDAKRFDVNFICSNGDIALHINPRLDIQQVVRNTNINNKWGREERHSALPFLFRRGEGFAIQVLVTQDCYLLCFNGHHMYSYAHRLDFGGVRFLKLYGDVEDVRIHYSEVRGYPHRVAEPPVPVQVPFDIIPMRHFADDVADLGPLNEGDSFLFTGIVDAKCVEFEVNLCSADGNIPLHIKSRFKKNDLLRSTKLNDSWQRSENTTPNPFRRGDRFAIQVLVTSTCYLIAVNGRHYVQYTHRFPFTLVTRMIVRGDVYDVQMHRNTVLDYPQRTLARQIL